MHQLRLSREACQEIADRTMASLLPLSAAEALERFCLRDRRVVEEVATDDATGKAFCRTIFATQFRDGSVALTVTVTPEPQVVRRARRLKLIADIVEGYKNAPQGLSTEVLSA